MDCVPHWIRLEILQIKNNMLIKIYKYIYKCFTKYIFVAPSTLAQIFIAATARYSNHGRGDACPPSRNGPGKERRRRLLKQQQLWIVQSPHTNVMMRIRRRRYLLSAKSVRQPTRTNVQARRQVGVSFFDRHLPIAQILRSLAAEGRTCGMPCGSSGDKKDGDDATQYTRSLQKRKVRKQ